MQINVKKSEKYDKIPDYHLHSLYSTDCSSELERIIDSSQKKGLSSICLTDHNDYDFPDTPSKIRFDLDIDNYLATLSWLKQKLLPTFDLRIGVEQGIMPSSCEALNSFSQEHRGIDFIIASSHVVNNHDPYYEESWFNDDGSEIDQYQMYKMYFEEMLQNVTNLTDYNVYGHMDYIFRYGPKSRANFEVVTSELFEKKYFPIFRDLIHDILKKIIENGKGIEINTGSLYRGMDFMHPHTLILQMYKELGGEILTFGSDSHDYQHIGYHFDEAAEMARSLGFKYYCTFKNMKPEFHTL